MMGFIFLPSVYWEQVAYLHVNSSCSPAQSRERGHLQGESGEEEEGDDVWGSKEVYSCFLSAKERSCFINPEATRAQRKKTLPKSGETGRN